LAGLSGRLASFRLLDDGVEGFSVYKFEGLELGFVLENLA
jgi:hypothetical protein